MRYKQIVSLGAWCQVAYQVERRYGNTSGQLFDWLVTPFEALLLTLKDRGARLGHTCSVDGENIKCGDYGLLYHHEFDRDADGIPFLTDEAIARCQSKFAHKMTKFAALADIPTLFIRLGTFAGWDRAWPYFQETQVFARRDSDRLIAALRGLFPLMPFHLAFVHHPRLWPIAEPWRDEQSSVHSLGDVAIAHLEGAMQWRGNDDQWDTLFDHLQAP